jgi:hypothetical protein
VQPQRNSVWRFLKKLKIGLPYDPALPLLEIYLQRNINQHIIEITEKTCLFAALLIIAKVWNQPRCQSINEQIKKICHIYTVEYYSVIKENEIMFFAEKWLGWN